MHAETGIKGSKGEKEVDAEQETSRDYSLVAGYGL